MSQVGRYLKKHTEALVKDVGIEAACELTGKSKATLGRYYSPHDEHAERFMPVDAVAAREAAASFPQVSVALAELGGFELDVTASRRNEKTTVKGDVNEDVIRLSRRFAMLMTEYHASITDGTITANEAQRILKETVALQKVLIDIKLHLDHAEP